jgi:TPR repeat protein
MGIAAQLGGAALLVFVSAGPAFGQTPSPDADRKTKSENVKAPATVPDTAIARYREARALERKGDERGALLAYEESAEAGYGRAQMRLAEIYDRGNTAVKRDYAKALHWYEKARAQGLHVPKPHPYVTGR